MTPEGGKVSFQEALLGALRKIYTSMASKEDVEVLKEELAQLTSSLEHISEDLQKIQLNLSHELIPTIKEQLDRLQSGVGLGGEEGVNPFGLAGALGAEGGVGGLGTEELSSIVARLDELQQTLSAELQQLSASPGQDLVQELSQNLITQIQSRVDQALKPSIKRLQEVVERSKAVGNLPQRIARVEDSLRSQGRMLWVVWLFSFLNLAFLAALLLERLGLITLQLF